MQIKTNTSFFPRLTKWHVRQVLKWCRHDDLKGLESIIVIDKCPDDPMSTKVAPYIRGFLYNGHYSRRIRNQTAHVVLYSDDIYFGIPKLLMASRICTLKIARTLAHEIGHHVIATRGYIHQPSEHYQPWTGIRDPHEEEMADQYAAEVMNRMLTSWRNRFSRLLAQMLSIFLYKAGIQDYWDGNYESSARLEFRARAINPDNVEAGQCYRHAMEKLKTQRPSPLTDIEKEWMTKRYNRSGLIYVRAAMAEQKKY